MCGYLFTFLGNPFHRVEILNMIIQCVFIYLLYFRLKENSKLTFHAIWHIPLFFMIFFSILYASIHFAGWRINFKEVLDFIIIAFFMAAVSKTKILDSMVITSIIMIILFCVSIPTYLIFTFLCTHTDLPKHIRFLLSSISLPILYTIILIIAYKIKSIKTGVSFLLEQKGTKSNKGTILTLSFITIFAFAFFALMDGLAPVFVIITIVAFFFVVAWNILGNVMDAHSVSKLGKSKDSASQETVRYRKSEHDFKHCLDEALITKLDNETKEMYRQRVRNHQAEKSFRINPPDSGLTVVDKYLEVAFHRALNDGIRLNILIQQKLTEFVDKGMLVTEIDQIISNLVNNALKYAFLGEEGRSIEGKVITLSVIDYTIMLFDTGLPVPDEIMKDMGNIGNTTKGTGTGLPMIIDIANKYGGTFTIIPDQGDKYGKNIKIHFPNW